MDVDLDAHAKLACLFGQLGYHKLLFTPNLYTA